MIIRIIVLTLHPQKLNKNRKMWSEPTKYCEGWNFGPRTESIANVWDVATKVVENYFSAPRPKGSLDTTNYKLQTTDFLKDLSDPNDLHEAKLLMLDISKAKFQLGWEPRLNIDQTVELTVDWYKRYSNEAVVSICLDQIRKFVLNSK